MSMCYVFNRFLRFWHLDMHAYVLCELRAHMPTCFNYAHYLYMCMMDANARNRG